MIWGDWKFIFASHKEREREILNLEKSFHLLLLLYFLTKGPARQIFPLLWQIYVLKVIKTYWKNWKFSNDFEILKVKREREKKKIVSNRIKHMIFSFVLQLRWRVFYLGTFNFIIFFLILTILKIFEKKLKVKVQNKI